MVECHWHEKVAFLNVFGMPMFVSHLSVINSPFDSQAFPGSPMIATQMPNIYNSKCVQPEARRSESKNKSEIRRIVWKEAINLWTSNY